MSTRKTLYLPIFAIIASLFGCMDQSAPVNIGPVEDLSPGIKGPDADTNGIRDDIDQLIEEKYAETPEVKQAAQQKARALQKFMESTTRDEALSAGEELERSAACLMRTLPGEENYKRRRVLAKEIEAWTANTRERFVKYWDSNEVVSGSIFPQAVEPVCD